MSAITFDNLKLDPWLIRQCSAIGIKTPTPVQANCIPKILEGKDCIGAAKTGSGKTLAFALPILQKLSEDPYGIFALILTPVRELACQIADQFNVIGKPMNLRTCVVVGGMDMVEQGKILARKPHIVVATPGRLADHLDSCDTFNLKKIKFLVLDEADRLLGGMFDEQIKAIFAALPKKKQCLFFSATINSTLDVLKEIIGTNIFEYEAPAEVATVEELEQHYVLCPGYVRDAYLVETIRTFREINDTGNIMVFTDSCKKCQVLSMMMNDIGLENVALHGMIPQKQRLAALAKFKSNVIKVLIATDVASRGLDIPTVQLVINHIIPQEAKDYIHRVGRTARAGRGGKAITLISPYDIPTLQMIEKHINTKLTEYKIDDTKVGEIFTQISVTSSEAHIKLNEKDFYQKRIINLRKKWILEGLDPDEEEKKLLKKKKKEQKIRRKRKFEKETNSENKSDIQSDTEKTNCEEENDNKSDTEENEKNFSVNKKRKVERIPKKIINKKRDNVNKKIKLNSKRNHVNTIGINK